MNRYFQLPALALVCAAGILIGGCGDGDESGGRAEVEQAAIRIGKTNWLTFGRMPKRTHYLKAPESLNPPLKQIWSFSDRVLIEFPPALHDGIAYLADKYGNVRAIDLSERRSLWDIQKDRRNVGPPRDATAPAYYRGRVYVAFMSGTLAALDAKTGKVDWKREMGSRLESSPLVAGGTLFIGTDKGNFYAIDPENGKVKWTFDAKTPVKSSASFAGGRVFLCNYSGIMYSLDAKSGRPDWITDTTKVAPFGDGGFYSSPAIGFGRVFAARDDGTVFAFDQKTGKVSWSFKTNGDIYGSPAIARIKGTVPTVYIGSYDSNLYALDARTGRKLWSYMVGGPVPGTATVIGHTVYTSSFRTVKSIGIDALTHRKTFSFDSPGYTPMISDGRNLYLVGYFSFHAFTPK